MSYRTQRRVEFRDTDAAGIAHYSVFFNFMEEVEHEMLRSLGLSVLIETTGGHISWPRVNATCDYTGSVRFEDIVDVELQVGRIGEKSVTYDFDFACEGRPIAKGRVTAVCCFIQPEGFPQSMKIPAEFAVKLKQLGQA
jgi:acyl-CoA thioester hydrolase